MLLTIRQRQSKLKDLGFYKLKVDGIEGAGTKKAYRDLQKKYFIRKTDIDGIYGNNTDILLRNAWNVKMNCKNFKLEEFKCECGGRGCTGYPKVINTTLLKHLQTIRTRYGVPIIITSGLRCKWYNSRISGSIKNSEHCNGKAIDFYSNRTRTLANRKSMIDYIIKMSSMSYVYCNGYWRTKWRKGTISASYMGTSIHMNV